MASVKKNKTEMAKYDPNKNYKWEPTDTFELQGEDFSLLLFVSRTLAHTTEKVAPSALTKCADILEALLVTGVEQGVIKEQKDNKAPIVPQEVANDLVTLD